MYVSGNALTISDAAGLITGTLAPQGNRAAVVAEQPGNYTQHTLAFTVANGGATFTATDDVLTKLGTCSSAFSGQRTAMTAEPPTTTTLDVAGLRCSPAQIKAGLGLDDEFEGITSCTATSATVTFDTQGMHLVGTMQWSDSTGQWSFVGGSVVCRVNGQPMSGPYGCPDNGP